MTFARFSHRRSACCLVDTLEVLELALMGLMAHSYGRKFDSQYFYTESYLRQHQENLNFLKLS